MFKLFTLCFFALFAFALAKPDIVAYSAAPVVAASAPYAADYALPYAYTAYASPYVAAPYASAYTAAYTAYPYSSYWLRR